MTEMREETDSLGLSIVVLEMANSSGRNIDVTANEFSKAVNLEKSSPSLPR